MTIQIYASDQPLLTIAMERANDEGEDDRSGLRELLEASEDLSSGWLAPLGVSCLFVHCEPASYFEEVGEPAEPHRFVRVETVPSDVGMHPLFARPAVASVAVVDAAAIRSEVERGLQQPAPADSVTSLSELWWTAVRARSPTNEVIELVVPVPVVSTVSEVLGDARWYFGPTSGIAGPPARLRAINMHFTTRLILDVYWDLWIGNAAGRAIVDVGVARVLARRGWERTL